MKCNDANTECGHNTEWKNIVQAYLASEPFRLLYWKSNASKIANTKTNNYNLCLTDGYQLAKRTFAKHAYGKKPYNAPVDYFRSKGRKGLVREQAVVEMLDIIPHFRLCNLPRIQKWGEKS